MKCFSALICTLILISCSSSKQSHTMENHPDQFIVFGEGGGFAGTVTKYKLYENGQLFRKKPRKNNFTEMTAIDETQAEQYFNTVETMGFRNMSCNEPENWYYLLEMENEDTSTKLVWGDNSRQATETLKLFCKNLLNVVKKQSELEIKSVTQ